MPGSRKGATGLLASLMLTLAACAVSPPSTSGPGSSTSVPGPSAEATPTPQPTVGAVNRPLEAGTYRIDLQHLAEGSAAFPAFSVTVPEGWATIGGWIVNHPRPGVNFPPVSVQFWDVDEVFGHPCQWDGTLFQPGPTAVDLADALVDVPLRNATQPIDVTLDGFAGKYLEWSVPADLVGSDGAFPACDLTSDGYHDFNSWTAKGWADVRHQQLAGQVDRLWILDINGLRLVIDAFSMPYATAADLEELQGVVTSIKFDR